MDHPGAALPIQWGSGFCPHTHIFGITISMACGLARDSDVTPLISVCFCGAQAATRKRPRRYRRIAMAFLLLIHWHPTVELTF